MAGGGRLSDLSDDLIRRILHFAPSKAAASTSALWRRFRSLWRASAAVNLEIRVPDRLLDLPRNDRTARILSLRDGEDPVTRLTFNLDADSSILANDFLYRDGAGRWSLQEIDVVGGLLSRPAARRVEELRVAVTHYGIAARLVEEPGSSSDIGLCSLGLGSAVRDAARAGPYQLRADPDADADAGRRRRVPASGVAAAAPLRRAAGAPPGARRRRAGPRRGSPRVRPSRGRNTKEGW